MAGDEGKSSHKNRVQQGDDNEESTTSSNSYAQAIRKEFPIELQRWFDELGGDYKSYKNKKSLASNTIKDSNIDKWEVKTNTPPPEYSLALQRYLY